MVCPDTPNVGRAFSEIFPLDIQQIQSLLAFPDLHYGFFIDFLISIFVDYTN